MINFLHQYIKNIEKIPDNEMLQILGSEPNLKAFGTFWNRYGDVMRVIAAAMLHDWTTGNSFTKEELDCYKAGLGAVPSIFAKCSAILEQKNLQSTSAKKTSK